MANETTCSFCPLDEVNHRTAEQTGLANHKFSTDGQFVVVDRKESRAKPDRQIATADVALRLLLAEKGILTLDELSDAEVRLHGRQRVPERSSSDG